MDLKKLKKPLLIAFVLFLVLLGGSVYFADRKLSQLVLGGLGEQFSTKIYSAPFVVESGRPLSLDRVKQWLVYMAYERTKEAPSKPGQFSYDSQTLQIYVRGFETPSHSSPSRIIRAKLDSQGKLQLGDEYDTALSLFYLEPLLISELSGENQIRREPSTIEEIPLSLQQAVIAIEDHRFYRHWGIDPRGIARALWHNLTSRGSMHGGSTITQQLAKNLFLTPKRTLRRKIVEAFMALYLEARYTKKEILTLYLNHIYMGQDGSRSIAGVKSAAKLFFNKDVSKLTLSESATLAGLIRSPYHYNPILRPEKSRRRRDIVLRRMFEEEFINHEAYVLGTAHPIEIKNTGLKNSSARPYDFFISEVLKILVPQYGEDVLFRYGLYIHTTMNPFLQVAAHEAVQNTPHQAALVAIDPRTGSIQALVGGKNFKESQFNRATQAVRQPGSSFKPFVYGAALEAGYTPIDSLQDKKKSYNSGKRKKWTPKNFDNVYSGTVTLRQALSLSKNAATVYLAQKIGPKKIIQFARKLGITSPLEFSLAIALGASELTLLELTNAYAAFANGGFRVYPRLITAIENADKKTIEVFNIKRESAMEPALAYVITSLLESVVKSGTAKRLLKQGWFHPTAGKTGTTNGGKDAWFIGFTKGLLAGVWVGDDEAKSIQVFGAGAALPIWLEFMKEASENGLKSDDFAKPEGLSTVTIDPETGYLAKYGCPSQIAEHFLAGSEPKAYCPLHPGGLKGWFQKLIKGGK